MSTRNLPIIQHEVDDYTLPWLEGPTPTVLLHPGLGGNHRLFRPWVPFLADAFRVVRVTARGQGGTARPDGFERSLENFTLDIIDLLDHLEVETVHWVGASGGGIMGQYAAIANPARVASLSLIATTARFRGPKGDYAEWLAPLDRGDQRAFLEGDLIRRFGTENPARTEWIISELCRTGGAESAAMHRWVHGVNLIDDLPAIRCPALIVTGEADSLTDVSDADIMHRQIPNSRIEILPGLPHNIAYTHPREVAMTVRAFLDELESGTPA